MTNNLKILTILSIFVFILTGYFCFSSLSVKNQIIANSNEEENNKTTDINNEDSNKKDNKEETSKLLILNIIIFIIFIIIAGIFIFIFIFSKLFIFKFNESKKDFKRENFCPGFFLISKIDDVKEDDADSFFETLFELILPKEKIDVNDIKEVEISLNFFTSEKIKPKVNELDLKYILDTSTTSFLDPEELDDNEIDPKNNNDNKKIINSKTKIKEMKKKYGKEFHSYLYSYLLYYLSETIAKKMNVIIKQSIYADIAGTKMSYRIKLKEKYNIDYDIMNKILKRLLSDDHSQNKNKNISFS